MRRRPGQRLRIWAADLLEGRSLLAAPVIPGNVGQVLFSQFEPEGFRTTVGAQLQRVKVHGPLSLGASTGTSGNAGFHLANSGLVTGSQFNGGGFRTVGLQLSDVKLRGGLTVAGSDNEDDGLPDTIPALRLLQNRGVIANSQFSDGGFGTLEFLPNGNPIGREGRVGLQLRNTRIGGPVNVGYDVDVIQPGANNVSAASAGATAAAAVTDAPTKQIDFSTNSGLIQNSQVNDGGFGDIGMQFSKVHVKGRVGTSTNSLFIKPEQDGNGPITVANRVFGQGVTSSVAAASAGVSTTASTIRAADVTSNYTNAATNSGRVVNSQFNDGGFGDIGLQWSKVGVGGNVSAVHNSLTVQPQNAGQGLITVQNVQFPNAPAASPAPAPGPLQTVPDTPAVVAADGDPVTNLPTPTGPISPYFAVPFPAAGSVTLPFESNLPLVNAASNSGLVKSSQFNAGGFGDEGLQWQHVHVGGNVNVVHNSLSIHPEGSDLAGIAVDNVNYGPAISARLAKHLAVLPYAVISPGSTTTGVTAQAAKTAPVLSPPNDRIVSEQQFASAGATDVFLQWNGIEHNKGLVIVHNVIQILGVGADTGPITLSNIRFPFFVPRLAPLVTVQASSVQAQAAPTGATTTAPVLQNTADNSGILDHAQFADGGFGDEGLQWKNVSVAGSVDVVHNQLSVDTSNDNGPAGDGSGPITVSNVTFNSGALESGISPKSNQIVLSPPDVFEHKSTHKIDLGKALPADPTVINEAANTGVMKGGQLTAGGAKHALLQWQCVKVNGGVKVVDNVLTISALDRPSAPITISNVTFA